MIKKKKAEPIKEVKEIADLIHSEDETIVVLFYGDSLVLAERLYNAGYRKASDIFEEIEEKIKLALKINKEEKDKMINSFYSLSLNLLSRLNSKVELLQAASDFIAELKKKYTESENINENR